MLAKALQKSSLCFFFSLLCGEIQFAVASNFRLPMEAIAADLKARYGIDSRLNFSSSSKLYAQITQGRPVDVFLSADEDKVDRLLGQKRYENSQSSLYAIGQLYLVAQRSLPEGEDNFSYLKQEGTSIALANARHAPYGVAAESFLNSIGSKAKKIRGESVSQVYHFFHSKSVPYALISSAQLQRLKAPQAYLKIPSRYYAPIRQKMLVLRKNPETELFLSYLKSKEYLQILKKHGYKIPSCLLPKI